LLEAAPGAKYKAALGTAYGAGAGTTKGREPRLVIAGHYPHQWRDYAEIDGSGGRLRYLYIPIEPFITMKKDLHG
jgi:hypothetical protein